jgi:hypothetical protein
LFIRDWIRLRSLTKEASWGGDRKIVETIIASPRIGYTLSIDDPLAILSTLKQKRRKKIAFIRWFVRRKRVCVVLKLTHYFIAYVLVRSR